MKWYLKVLRQCADFEGRAGREEYWMFVLFNIIFSFATVLVASVLYAVTEKLNLLLFSYFYPFAVLIPGLAVSIRRLHDTGRSAWYLLLSLIPFVGGIWLFVLMLLDSDPQINRYGENPRKTGMRSRFDGYKSAAVALIISSIIWISVNLLTSLMHHAWIAYGVHTGLFSLFINDAPQFLSGFFKQLLGLRLFYLLLPTGFLIAGILLLQKKYMTNHIAYIFLFIAIVWISLICYNFYEYVVVFSKLDIGVNYLSVFQRFVEIFIPITLILISIFVFQQESDRNFVANWLIAGACFWFVSEVLLLFIWDMDSKFMIQGILSKMLIMMPCSLIALAGAIRKDALDVKSVQHEVTDTRAMSKTVPGISGKVYTERDNKGMRVDTISQSMAYWLVERINNPRKDPFVYYVFKNESDARAALEELPFIHAASDSGKLVCDELFRYGYFAVTNNGVLTGEYDAFVAGADFTHDMWRKTHAAFSKHHGVRKNDLEPEQKTEQRRTSAGSTGNVIFIREDRDNNCVWRVHKASCKADAMAFLSQQQVVRPLYYVVVETPEGNFGKDKDGFYQE